MGIDERYPGTPALRLLDPDQRELGPQPQPGHVTGCHAGPARWEAAPADRRGLHGRGAVGSVPDRYRFVVRGADDACAGRLSAGHLALAGLCALRPRADERVVRWNRV